MAKTVVEKRRYFYFKNHFREEEGMNKYLQQYLTKKRFLVFCIAVAITIAAAAALFTSSGAALSYPNCSQPDINEVYCNGTLSASASSISVSGNTQNFDCTALAWVWCTADKVDASLKTDQGTISAGGTKINCLVFGPIWDECYAFPLRESVTSPAGNASNSQVFVLCNGGKDFVGPECVSLLVTVSAVNTTNVSTAAGSAAFSIGSVDCNDPRYADPFSRCQELITPAGNYTVIDY